MLSKERDPGGWTDLFRVYDDDVWAAISRQRAPMMERWADTIGDGVELVGRDTRGGRRLRQSPAYLPFMSTRLPPTHR